MTPIAANPLSSQTPAEAPYALGDAIAEINAMGGIVAAPFHDAGNKTLPWALSLGGTVGYL